MLTKRILTSSTYLLFALVSSFGCDVLASPSAHAASDYDNGLAAYKMRNYALAAQYFKRAAAGNNNTALVWLYAGHAYSGAGDRVRAIEAYKKLEDDFPDSDEAKLGLKCLQRLSPAIAANYGSQGAPVDPLAAEGSHPTASAAPVMPAAPAPVPLTKRIVVVPPLGGHPAVSDATKATVRGIIAKLPKNIYSYLEKHDVTVNISPNIEDKWPGSGDGMRGEVSMGEEPSHTYGRDIYIYEREKMRGPNILKEARDQSEISQALIHEIGHAINDCAGNVANSAAFKAEFDADIANMPLGGSGIQPYFGDQVEGCAEILGRLAVGEETPYTQNMPLSKAFLKHKIALW